MITLHPSDLNRLISMLRLHSPLLDPQAQILERTELTIMDHVSPRHMSEFKVSQTANRLYPRYYEGNSTSPCRTNLNNYSHNIPTMMQTNHSHEPVDHPHHLKQSITLMNVRILSPNWNYTTPMPMKIYVNRSNRV